MTSLGLTVYGPEVARSGLTGKLDRFVQQRSKLAIHERFFVLHSRGSIEKFYALTGSTGGAHWPLVLDLFDLRPACATLWKGEDALVALQKLKGNTQPARAAEGTVRSRFCCDNPVTNLIHVSDGQDIMRSELEILHAQKSGTAPEGWNALECGDISHSSFHVLLKALSRKRDLPSTAAFPDDSACAHATRSVRQLLSLPLDTSLRALLSAYLAGDPAAANLLLEVAGPLSAWDRLIVAAGGFAMPHWHSVLQLPASPLLEAAS